MGWGIAIALLVVLLYLLFVPLVLYVNTDNNAYYVKVRGLAKASIEGDKQYFIRIRLDTLFSHFYFYPLRKKKSKKKAEKTKEKLPKKRTFHLDQAKWIKYTNIGRRLLRSFHLKRLEVDVDTGDCIQNARLYPVFAFLNHYVGNFRVNFQDRNRLLLHVQNRPIYIIKAFINP